MLAHAGIQSFSPRPCCCYGASSKTAAFTHHMPTGQNDILRLPAHGLVELAPVLQLVGAEGHAQHHPVRPGWRIRFGGVLEIVAEHDRLAGAIAVVLGAAVADAIQQVAVLRRDIEQRRDQGLGVGAGYIVLVPHWLGGMVADNEKAAINHDPVFDVHQLAHLLFDAESIEKPVEQPVACCIVTGYP